MTSTEHNPRVVLYGEINIKDALPLVTKLLIKEKLPFHVERVTAVPERLKSIGRAHDVVVVCHSSRHEDLGTSVTRQWKRDRPEYLKLKASADEAYGEVPHTVVPLEVCDVSTFGWYDGINGDFNVPWKEIVRLLKAANEALNAEAENSD